MEDQQDAGGNSISESVVKNMGSENQGEESIAEGDGGEIMVEVVGSDVFVGGISGDKVGDLGDKIKESQVHSAGDGNKVGKSVVGPAESKDEKRFVAREEVEVATLCKSVDVKGDVVSALPPSGVSVVDDEVRNPGIEAVGGSSAGTVLNSKVVEASPMEIVEQKITEVEKVTKDGAASEAVLDDKTEVEGKKEVLPSSGGTASCDQFSSAGTVPSSEVVGASPIMSDEEKITEAANDGATSESLDRSTKAVLDEKNEVEEKKVALPSSDNTVNHDQSSSAMPVSNSEVIGASPTVIGEEKITGFVTKDGGTSESLNRSTEAVLDEKTEIQEKTEVLPSSGNAASNDLSSAVPVLSSASPMVIDEEKINEAEAVTKDGATSESLNRPTEVVLDEKAEIEEKNEVLPSSDSTASHDQFSSAATVPKYVVSEDIRTAYEAVAMECADLVIPEPLNYPEGTDLNEETDIEEKKEVLPSTDASAKSVATDEVTGPSSVVISEETRTEDEAVTKECGDLVTPKKIDIEEKKELLPSPDDSANCAAADEVTGPSPVVISEENSTEDKEVNKECADIVTPEPLNHREKFDLNQETDAEEKKEVLPSNGDSSVAADEVTGPSQVVISKEKSTEDEAVTKECADLVTPEPLNQPRKFDLNEKTDTEERKEELPSNDDSAKCVAADEVTGPSPVVISEEKSTEDEAVNMDVDDLVTPEPISHPAEEFDLNENTDTAEKKEVLPSNDDSAKCVAADEVTGLSPVVISEEKSSEHEAVNIDVDDLVTPEPISHPAEEFDLNEKTDTEEKKEVLPSNDDSVKCVAADEVTRPSPVVISEEKSTEDEVVNMDDADLVTPEPISHPAEADSGIADNEGNNEVSPSSDYSANHDHIDADSVMSHTETKAAQGCVKSPDTSLNLNVEFLENVQDDGIDSVAGEAHSVDANDGQELPECGTQDDGSFRAKAELATTDGDGGIDEKSVDDKEVFAAESKTSILESDAQASDVQDEKQGCLKLVSDDRVDGVSHTGPKSIHESSSANDRVEATGSGKCLGTDSELEIHKAHENRVFPDEQNQLTDTGVTDVIDSEKSLSVEIQEDKIKKDSNTKSSSCSPDKEIVQADSGMYPDQGVAKTLGTELDGRDAAMSQAKVVDGDGSCEKVEEIKSEIPAVDVSAELVEEGAVEDHAVDQGAIVNSEGIDNVVQECGLPQSTKQDVSEKIIETSDHEVEKINSMPNEVVSDAPVSDTAQVLERTEKAESVGEITRLENVPSEEDHEPRECNGFGTSEDHTSEMKVVYVKEEQDSDHIYHGEKEVDAEAEVPSEAEKLKLSIEEKLKHMSSFRMSPSGYLTPPENESTFAPSDLVWGKVRSHPWWPGQIFDPDDASEKAVKYHKKDSYLVAYFGDKTFAWNDSSALKPFKPHFTQIEKQSSSEAFHNAVTCALEEVERRVELGLSCSCIPKGAYRKIEAQVVENTGIRREANLRYGVDRSTEASHFEPNKLLDYITGLAPRASSRANRLDLVIARAQLAAYFRFTGYRSLSDCTSSGQLLESDADPAKVSDRVVASHKRKHVQKDTSQSKKEKNSGELMGDGVHSPDAEDKFGADDFGKLVLSSGKKRKALDPLAEGSEKRLTVYAAKVSTSATQAPKPSFKIGECIRRVASQLTGSTPSIKGSNDETVIDGTSNIHEQSEKQSAVVSVESLSVSELLSRIELMAQGPKKSLGLHNNIRAFFMGFRNSIIRRGRKKKSEQTVGGSGEEFEFDDVNDSYWTDRIVQIYPEGQLPHEGENGTPNYQIVPFAREKPVKTRKPHSKKRVSSAVSPKVPTPEDENAKRRKQESSPAELILNFAERNHVPTEINLNKMFRRFGPLMESETEVDHESGCAKVIFKRGSDAEVARNSAEKFSIFGPALVKYHVGYSPVISVKILPIAMPQPQEDGALMV